MKHRKKVDHFKINQLHFRLTTGRRGTSLANMLTDSKEGSIYRKIFQNNIDNSSFQSSKTSALQDLLDRPKEVHLLNYQSVLGAKKVNCKITPVWLGKRLVSYTSFALTKNSPLKQFMKMKMFKMTEMGQINQIVSKFELKPPVCNQQRQKGNPLGLCKICIPFIVGYIGLVTSLTILAYEKIARPKKSNWSQKLQRFYDVRTNLVKTTKKLKLYLLEVNDQLLFVEKFITNLNRVQIK